MATIFFPEWVKHNPDKVNPKEKPYLLKNVVSFCTLIKGDIYHVSVPAIEDTNIPEELLNNRIVNDYIEKNVIEPTIKKTKSQLKPVGDILEGFRPVINQSKGLRHILNFSELDNKYYKTGLDLSMHNSYLYEGLFGKLITLREKDPEILLRNKDLMNFAPFILKEKYSTYSTYSIVGQGLENSLMRALKFYHNAKKLYDKYVQLDV